MSVKCQYVSGSGRKAKVQKAILCLHIVLPFQNNTEMGGACQLLNLKENCSTCPLLDVSSHCFGQRIELIKNGTSKSFEININTKHKKKEEDTAA